MSAKCKSTTAKCKNRFLQFFKKEEFELLQSAIQNLSKPSMIPLLEDKTGIKSVPKQSRQKHRVVNKIFTVEGRIIFEHNTLASVCW